MVISENEYDIAPDQSYEIDLFRPEDAEGVTRLFRSVYGAGYPIKTFIDPNLLREENRAGRTISSVARTEKGDIVGHNAVFRSAAWDWIYESGAGLVHRHYRGGRGIFRDLTRHGQVVVAPKIGIQVIFGESVLNHVFAQKMVINLGWRHYAVEVDLMPAAAYTQEGSAKGRVSASICLVTLVPRPHRVYIPEVYRESLEFLYSGLDDTREFCPAGGSWPDGPVTDIKSQYFEFARVARLAVHQVGADFETVFQEKEREVREKGVHLVEVWLKLTWPFIDEVVKILRTRGYFMGGLLPRWFDDDGLLMQKVMARPGWDDIKIYSERAEKILDLVKNDWAETRESA